MNHPLILPIHPKLRHPRTGEPLQAIALHPRTGNPVWPIMGAAEDDDDPWKKAFGDQTPEQVKSALDAAKAAAGKGGSDDSPWTKLFAGKTPEQVRTELDTFKSSSRTWEDRAKDKQGKAAIAEVVLEMLGLKGEPLDPEKLKQDLGGAQTETKATKIENAVLRRASNKDGDPALLTDSREFMAKVTGLDPAAEDFTTKLDEAVEKFVTENPRYKLGATGVIRPAPVRQQGQPSEGKTGGVASGQALFEERRGKKTAATAT